MVVLFVSIGVFFFVVIAFFWIKRKYFDTPVTTTPIVKTTSAEELNDLNEQAEKLVDTAEKLQKKAAHEKEDAENLEKVSKNLTEKLQN